MRILCGFFKSTDNLKMGVIFFISCVLVMFVSQRKIQIPVYVILFKCYCSTVVITSNVRSAVNQNKKDHLAVQFFIYPHPATVICLCALDDAVILPLSIPGFITALPVVQIKLQECCGCLCPK